MNTKNADLEATGSVSVEHPGPEDQALNKHPGRVLDVNRGREGLVGKIGLRADVSLEPRQSRHPDRNRHAECCHLVQGDAPQQRLCSLPLKFPRVEPAADVLFVTVEAGLRIVPQTESGPLPPSAFPKAFSRSDVLISLGKNPVWPLRGHGILGRRDYDPCVRIPL